MQAKRSGHIEAQDLGPADDAGLTLHALRAGALPAAPKRGDDEKLSIYWRVFGGTLLSIAALAAITLYNSFNNNISSLQSELSRANEARAAVLAEMRAEFAKAAEGKADFVRKDEFTRQMTSSSERMQALQTQNNGQNATLLSVKTELDGLKERVTKNCADDEGTRKEASLALEAVKREQNTTTDALKKDVAALEVIREKLATISADVKSGRDDFAKLRQEVDKNAAYDIERRDSRTAQMKEYDALVKDVQKTVQECRERIARLEAVAGANPPAPPSSITPVGGFQVPGKKSPARVSAPAPPEVEEAPAPRLVRDR